MNPARGGAEIPEGVRSRGRNCTSRITAFGSVARLARMKFGRKTDLLSPQEREIVDRFERGVIDAAEAGRLLIASVQRVDDSTAAPAEPAAAAKPAAAPEEAAAEEETVAYPNETAEETAARLLVERIAREVDEELKR
jgi:hypothetical protein